MNEVNLDNLILLSSSAPKPKGIYFKVDSFKIEIYEKNSYNWKQEVG